MCQHWSGQSTASSTQTGTLGLLHRQPDTPVAVVGRAEHRDHLLLVLPQEALTDELVCADDEAQPVDVVEVFADVLQGPSTHSTGTSFVWQLPTEGSCNAEQDSR